MQRAVTTLLLCTLGAAAHAQAPIERIKVTDNDLTCRQIHTEIGEMDKLVAASQQSRDTAQNVATGAEVASVAAPVAAQAAAVSGSLGAAVGLARLAPFANLFGTAAKAAGTQQAGAAQDRLQAATGRKDHLAALFLNKGCKTADLDAAPVASAPLVVATAVTQTNAPANVPVADIGALVERLAGSVSPLENAGGDGLLDARAQRLLGNAPRLVVPGFRVVFVTRNSATAYAGGGLANLGQGIGSNRTITQAQNRSIEISLEGVDPQLLQAIADRAYADFMTRLAATGREIVGVDALRATDAFRALQPAKTEAGRPYAKSPMGTPKNYVVVSPAALPLWFLHGDPLGDVGAFALENWRSLNKLSVDTQSVVVVPTVTIDFASVQSSGRSNLGSSAEVGAQAAMSIEQAHTQLQVFHAKIPLAGEGEATRLKRGVELPGEYGRTRVLDQTSNAGLANALTALTGTQNTQRSATKLAVVADPERYAQVALRGAFTANALFVDSLGAKR